MQATEEKLLSICMQLQVPSSWRGQNVPRVNHIIFPISQCSYLSLSLSISLSLSHTHTHTHTHTHKHSLEARFFCTYFYKKKTKTCECQKHSATPITCKAGTCLQYINYLVLTSRRVLWQAILGEGEHPHTHAHIITELKITSRKIKRKKTKTKQKKTDFSGRDGSTKGRKKQKMCFSLGQRFYTEMKHRRKKVTRCYILEGLEKDQKPFAAG